MMNVLVLHLDRCATLLQGKRESNRRMVGEMGGKGAEQAFAVSNEVSQSELHPNDSTMFKRQGQK